MLKDMYSWMGTMLLVALLAYCLWIGLSTGSRITELDALAAAGMALDGQIPETYQFADSKLRYQQVQVKGGKRQSLEVSMVYQSLEGKPPLEVLVYLDPHTAEVWGTLGLKE